MAREQNLNVELYLEDVRLSYPHLFEPQAFKGDKNAKPRFSAAFILDKKRHASLIAKIEDAIEDVKEAKWPDGVKLKDDNICFFDGDDTDNDEYQGAMILKAASPESSPPTVIDRDKSPLNANSKKPYGGCFVNAVVRLYGYTAYGNQINASLEAVQYYRKGDAFGAAPIDVDSKFKDFGEDDDDVRPLRSRRDRDEGEDRSSRRRSRDDYEDEDEQPRRRRSRDDD